MVKYLNDTRLFAGKTIKIASFQNHELVVHFEDDTVAVISPFQDYGDLALELKQELDEYTLRKLSIITEDEYESLKKVKEEKKLADGLAYLEALAYKHGKVLGDK